MSKRHFMDLYRARAALGNAVCVGLDLDFGLFPEYLKHRKADPEIRLYDFAESIIEKTHDIVLAYKPNIAFYEAYGQAGLSALMRIIAFIRDIAPDVPVILDNKRGDIGNTNLGYVHSAFELFGADAVTVHPYLGAEALKPFLEREDKGIIVLCRTSNKGAGEFQDRQVILEKDPVRWIGLKDSARAMPLYQFVAYRISTYWNKLGNCALVVGATYPDELGQVRQIVGDMPLLIPGIGAQGGDVEAVVRNGRDSNGHGMIINSSRGIIYAEDPRAEALRLDGFIRQFATA